MLFDYRMNDAVRNRGRLEESNLRIDENGQYESGIDKLAGISFGSNRRGDQSASRKDNSQERGDALSNNTNKRFSLDDSYLSAVNRGDMVTAQRMVDEAAI